MTILLPLTVEIFLCFALSSSLLFRYADFVNQNVVTTIAVFISWFLSFMVIFILPADISSAAYRQCIVDHSNQSFHTYDHIVWNQSLSSPSQLNIDAITNQTHGNSSIELNSSHVQSVHETPVSLSPMSNSTGNSTNNGTSDDLDIVCTLPWNYIPERILPRLWRVIYWTSQFLTWIVLPLMQSYCMAGDFTSLARLKSSIRANLIYYSSLGIIFFILLIYVVVNNGLDFSKLKVIAITSSNTWGLLLLVVLLGHGLVELPRYFLRRSQCSKSLHHIYYRVARINAEKCEAEERLDDVLEEIHQAHNAIGENITHPCRRCLDKIIHKCPPDWQRRSVSFRRQVVPNSNPDIHYLNLDTMIKLHQRVIQAVHIHRQTSCRWVEIIREAIDWEDVAHNQSEAMLTSFKMFQRSIQHKQPTTLMETLFSNLYTPKLEWYWKCVFRGKILKAVGILTIMLSVSVVWSEMTFFVYTPTLSIFAALINLGESQQSYFFMEVTSIISIGYLALCAFFTVFRMRIFNIYHLASNQQTDEYSILFSGMLLCRLTAPLCLNYLCLIHKDSHITHELAQIETAFTGIMGHLDLIPIINNGLNILLPVCISAICLALYFDMGTHIMHHLGFERFVQGDELTDNWIENGRELVKREKAKLLRERFPRAQTAAE